MDFNFSHWIVAIHCISGATCARHHTLLVVGYSRVFFFNWMVIWHKTDTHYEDKSKTTSISLPLVQELPYHYSVNRKNLIIIQCFPQIYSATVSKVVLKWVAILSWPLIYLGCQPSQIPFMYIVEGSKKEETEWDAYVYIATQEATALEGLL